MTNDDIFQIAMRQSACDINCRPEDFLKSENVVVESIICEKARKYYREPVSANLVSYGNNIVASVKNEYRGIIEDYIKRYTFYHCFETPNLLVLNDEMQKHGQKVCFMAEYYLPDVGKIMKRKCKYRMKKLMQTDFESLYIPAWSNALCADRRELDVIGMGAYDGDKLVGLAGASADCEKMWQIGIDVLPEYRRQGIASALTSCLAYEILQLGIVPFYCSAWSNIRSVRNGIRSGFVPAWAELTVKSADFTNNINEIQVKELI